MFKFDSKAFTNFAAKRTAYADLVKAGAKAEDQQQGFTDMMDALGEDTMAEIKNQVHLQTEDYLDANRGETKMTNEEVKFFNEIKTDTGFKEPKLLPETVVTEVFDDMVQAHPFLQAIGLVNQGISLKIIQSDASGVIAWGNIFGEISSQLDAKFTETKADQSKATAFMVLPKDLSDFGPTWIKQYVITQISEAFAAGAEKAFLTGDGNSQPIGLNRSVAKNVTVTGGVYPEKASAGTLTFADTKTAAKELAGVIKGLSTKENGHAIVAKGKTVLVMAPGDSLEVEAQFMVQNLAGQFVTAMPFGLVTVESEFQPDKKVTAFVQGRYDAFQAGPLKIQAYDQTLAMEDMDLYTAKQFFYGKAKDDKAAAVYDLALAAPGTDTTQTTTGGDAGK
ncbi:major head protein Cps [Lactobacillus plantarum JDM1] [Lactiplantibacillus mudanjiangensis]|uniref:phage major capsid protein n=1 Tax=Lactiplantibacillus mudanjiangensis TaxID=1296538 RepID=UPI001014B04F|nr:major head protein Cps [Lactobacillus plantarum JDM1] [Lactiplantibacillus mudanjiangensis]